MKLKVNINKINFPIVNCRRCDTHEFGRKIKHYFEGRAEGDGIEIAEGNLHAIGNWKNYCDSYGTESRPKQRQTRHTKFVSSEAYCSRVATQANYCSRQRNDHQFVGRKHNHRLTIGCLGK